MSGREQFNTMLTIAHGIAKGVAIVAPGLSPARMAREIGAELRHQRDLGRTELAAALFSQSNAFVMYPRQPGPQLEQARGRGM